MIQRALRTRRLFFFAPLLASALLLSCLAGAGALTAAVKPSDPGSGSAALAAALDSINPDSIKTDLYYVAADDKLGRDTPSEGQRTVARFIAARLERLGWTPAARDGWFFTYPVFQKKLDESATGIAWRVDASTSGKLVFGTDYFLPSSRDVRTNDVKGQVVFAGGGSSADFKHKELAGKWALCFDEGEDVTDVGRRAREAHCIGLLMGPGPKYSGDPYSERFAKILARQRYGSVSWPRSSTGDDEKAEGGKKNKGKKNDAKKSEPAEDDDDEARKSFASVLLTRESVTSLLEAAKLPESPRFGAKVCDLTETRLVPDHVDCENVCGLWPGSDPKLGDETILVTAHYDHVGVSNGEIYNGADDNGSGTCGLLAIAEALTKAGPMRRSVMLMWMSGEEKGLWGSKAWTQKPWLPGNHKPICDINIDMIGRNAPDMLLITPTRARSEYNGLVRLAERLSPLEGFPKLKSADKYYERSDHYNFAKIGLPIAFLFDDVHEDYHQPTDDADKIDYDKIKRVVRLVVRMLDGLQEDRLDLK